MSSRPQILVVDNHEPNLVAVRMILKDLGMVVTVSSGGDTLRHLLHQEFDLILLDVVMPDIDGIETAQLIRQREQTRETPIIFLTALTDIEERLKQMEGLGKVDCMIKPFSPETLRAKVLSWLDLPSSQDSS